LEQGYNYVMNPPTMVLYICATL